jgi:hypothetical protein
VLVRSSLRFDVSPVIAAIDTIMIVSIQIALALIARPVGIKRIRMR